MRGGETEREAERKREERERGGEMIAEETKGEREEER
jgi:hypothetical protein